LKTPLKLTPLELEAVNQAAGEILAGDLDPDSTSWTARLINALERAKAKLEGQVLDGATTQRKRKVNKQVRPSPELARVGRRLYMAAQALAARSLTDANAISRNMREAADAVSEWREIAEKAGIE
jgi:hypothetical protein